MGVDPAAGADGMRGAKPHWLLLLRKLELGLATEAMGVLAASELGAVRRFSAQSRVAKAKPIKALEAFGRVQDRLAASFPPEFLEIVRGTPGDIRIVADAHLEWLDVDGLPLGLRRNVSRVPVTPGNLFISKVLPTARLRLSVEDFSEVLVICALARRDRIRPFMELAVREMGPALDGRVLLRFKEVTSVEGFLATLKGFEGAMVIFDGHGTHAPGEAACLMLGDVACEVWSLMERGVRIPPIVVLSACDTHAADRNHATSANGLLALGARAVLATVFPLDAREAAVFAARLLLRVAAFVPAAVALFGRCVTWTEIVSGMLRMQLTTEFLRKLMRKRLIDEGPYYALHCQANVDINGGSGDPFAELLRREAALGIGEARAARELRLTVATSSPISYVHLGRPDTITVDTVDHLAALARLSEAW